MKFLATRTVHWPSGPIDCCDNHANQLMELNKILGGLHIVHTKPAENAECINCINEANKGVKNEV